MSEYQPIYQLYYADGKELIKLDESTDRDLMLEKLAEARAAGKKQAHLQYSFEKGGAVQKAAVGAIIRAAGIGIGKVARAAGRGIGKGARAVGRGAAKTGKFAHKAGKAGYRGLDSIGRYTDTMRPDHQEFDTVPDQQEVYQFLQETDNTDHYLYLKPVKEWDNFDLWNWNKLTGEHFETGGLIEVLEDPDGKRIIESIEEIDLDRAKTDERLQSILNQNIQELRDRFGYDYVLPEHYEMGGAIKGKRNYRVRFHLGRGKNFMNWKIEQIKPREDWFYVPDDVQLIMTNCVLTNKPARAEKIFTGEINKEPIAYVQCEDVSVIEGDDIDVTGAEKLTYNPRVKPYWFNESGVNVDGSEFEVLFTKGRSVYTKVGEQLFELGGFVERFQQGGLFDVPHETIEEQLVIPEQPAQIELFAKVTDQPELTKENVATQLTVMREMQAPPQFTLLSFGGGQDSWAILLSYIHDESFRQKYAPHDFVVVMSDTGNEHPYTYKAVEEAAELCKKHNIPFYFLPQGDKYHTPAWENLKANMERNQIVMAAWGVKSCTASLKIAPVDKFMYEYMSNLYGYNYEWGDRIGKNWETYEKQFRTKARVLIGFAKDEEERVIGTLKTWGKLPKWKQSYVQFTYPLIEEGWNRAAAQRIIKKYHSYVVPPSNCMICFYQSNEELVWLERNYPEEFQSWVKLENAKLTAPKWVSKPKNNGVYGAITLTEKLEQAKNSINKDWKDGALAHKPIGEWTDDELWEYKMSHGHCVKSAF